MLDTIIAERYAKALFQLADENGKLDKVYDDMRLLMDIIGTSKDFKQLLVSPIVRPDKKLVAIDAILEGKIDEITKQFYHLIANKRREKFLAGIAKEFVNQYKAYKNIVTIEIRTVEPLTDALRKRAIELIEKRRNITVELVEVTDPKLIGGFIVSTGTLRFDSSLATSIKKLKKEFEENLYVREF